MNIQLLRLGTKALARLSEMEARVEQEADRGLAECLRGSATLF